jgi:DNA end-binding protein Ku
MARTLVENLADKWDPSQYTDQYRENLMKIIKAKLKGRKPTLAEHVEPKQAEVVDLMERLRQSLQGAGAKGAKAARGRKTAKSATSRGRKTSSATKRRRAA